MKLALQELRDGHTFQKLSLRQVWAKWPVSEHYMQRK